MPGTEPNVEHKLFVGGCPPGSAEDDLRKIFEPYGTVEEIFIMRGGSRSGMSCAFVRFQTQQMAQLAIEAIHGQVTLPESTEPLVVRWADAPGSRRRNTRRSSSSCACSGGSGGTAGAGRSRRGISAGPHEEPLYIPHGSFGYGAMHLPMQMPMPLQAIGGAYGSVSFYPQSVGGYASGHMGYLPQHAMMAYQPQQQAVGSSYGQQAAHIAPSQVMLGMHGSGMSPVMSMGQYSYSGGMLPGDQGEALARGATATRAAPPALGVPPTPRCAPPRGRPPS